MEEVKELLEAKYHQFANKEFIATDPIYIPHMFDQKENIEIAGFLSASIAWGKRSTILRNAIRLMNLMDNNPYAYLMNLENEDLDSLSNFCHRTFNATDLIFFLKALSNIYRNHNGMEALFIRGYEPNHSIKEAIIHFREVFFELTHEQRTKKHIADVEKGASAKRINMFLRWMVRKDKSGVDFGIWDQISTADLYLPLDVHTGNVARSLGLLNRKQNDWLAVEELTHTLKLFDPKDPVKYDFALFGMGIFDGMKSAN